MKGIDRLVSSLLESTMECVLFVCEMLEVLETFLKAYVSIG